MAEFDFGGDHSGHNHGESVVYMYPSGDISMELHAHGVNENTGCDEWSYGIFEAATDLDLPAVGDLCATYVGDFYDPTHQCPPFSGSEYCYGTDYLCNDTSYDYDCDFVNDRYSCAPGDLSGKFGKMDSYDFILDEDGPQTLIPKTDDMVGMVFVIYCGDNDSGISYLACAAIEEYVTPAPTVETEGDGAVEMMVMTTMAVTLFAMMF